MDVVYSDGISKAATTKVGRIRAEAADVDTRNSPLIKIDAFSMQPILARLTTGH